ncbi:tRNA preQ1(34) S-adenosylmethionine ribosyltransferase-isomerase QueA [SCandidatus Aminicenantes bacterium Aminicenantia_JdfR_composite]|nr:tRNA preQ1(34) S-adenosylmethionine ribosyltransferase-isomerase QueA [SCandidatus Aminicenantes bacterium Aminicenantia_JdfR_composite]MCP2597529.1 tRNA preQ1(34) S-adenosylmethionine ribosyltransferase-isomerase QueA [Candidatus Aminicenantes bacterium AC-335-G13]
MDLSLFDYNLPKELIARFPLPDRDQSRLLILIRRECKIIHSHFRNLPEYLKEGDLLIINNSKVIPARLIGSLNGSFIDCLLTKKINEDTWEGIFHPARKVKTGKKIKFSEGLEGEIIRINDYGKRLIQFNRKGNDLINLIRKIGFAPLPPYIKRKNEEAIKYKEFDLNRYQTIYAKEEGSIAAPTAGLHFTPKVIDKIKEKGVEVLEITLHVGEATFRPVKTKKIEEHKMGEEYFHIKEEVANKINLAKKDKRRIIAVGTTTVRALESAWKDNYLEPGFNKTELFIYPGYKFKVVDALLTNFHLPKSTLLMLVSAFASQNPEEGIKLIKKAYKEAIKRKYRFYSYGDCMLIL